MIDRILVSLLIALVLACPVWCPLTASAGLRPAEEQATKACCERCQQRSANPAAPDADGSVPPVPEDEPPPATRQCFCGDAFLAKIEQDLAGAIAGHLTGISLLPAIECEAPVLCNLQSEYPSPFWLSGRDRRCLFMSLLC